MNTGSGATFPEQVLNRVVFCDKEVFGQGIGDDAIDFLRHGAVETAQTGFDMCYGNSELGGGQRYGNGRIDITNDQNSIGIVLKQDGLNALEDLGGLNSLRTGANVKVNVWRGYPHLAEKNIGECIVIVLASVH